MIEVIGYAATLCIATLYIPQVIQSWKTKQTRDISYATYIISAVGSFLWLVYGLSLDIVPIIITNCMTLALGLLTLVLKFKFDRSQV